MLFSPLPVWIEEDIFKLQKATSRHIGTHFAHYWRKDVKTSQESIRNSFSKTKASFRIIRIEHDEDGHLPALCPSWCRRPWTFDWLTIWLFGLFGLFWLFWQKEGVDSSMMEIVICQPGAHHGAAAIGLSTRGDHPRIQIEPPANIRHRCLIQKRTKLIT